MTPLEAAGLTIFILVLLIGFFATLLGLPGTLVILLDAFVFALVTGFERIGFGILLALVAISALAESLEFLFGVTWARRYGTSKRAIAASVVGGIAGAVLLTPVLLGLGALIGSFLGALAGAFAVELLAQQELKPAARAGFGALAGRLAGLFAKGACGLAMVIITLMAIYS
ncbi:MAG: DUF456 domain-containing protein [Syntrophaceae bacterium]|nr:DUF456 domain-containing protein [Syntrophaceae bacterium]